MYLNKIILQISSFQLPPINKCFIMKRLSALFVRLKVYQQQGGVIKPTRYRLSSVLLIFHFEYLKNFPLFCYLVIKKSCCNIF